jgi:hypothetical protein
MNIVPFRQGDMAGKRELAIDDARVQAEKTSGIRQKLYQLQESVGRELGHVECPLQHVFGPNAVARTMFIPAGTVIVGKIHKHEHFNTLSQGRVSVMTEAGGVEELQGPLTMLSPAGCKRAVYAHTDAVWTTFHNLPRDGMTLEEIEDHVIAKTYEDYQRFIEGNTMNKIEVAA